MQPLNLLERQEAIRLISNQYYDYDVINAIRSLLELKELDRRAFRDLLNTQYPSGELPEPVLDDTKPMSPIFDGD